ncbi:hypothetical protein MMC18_002733 [Xylographa bjoerkii]|nr:hypothetical protein [Xylographa bjoerkii]
MAYLESSGEATVTTAPPPERDTDSTATHHHHQPNPNASGLQATTAREYYNAPATDSFYRSLWGGEHIHIGTYTSPSDTITAASQRTVERMAALARITPATRVLDIGAGYGGAARWLARTYGCKVTCLNLSEVQNARNRERTREQGLEALVAVVDGVFEHLPFADATFDLVWCQDCLIHASDRHAVVAEVARVLVSSGADVILTDHMATRDADPERVGPIKKRLKLKLDLATRQFYQDVFLAQGFEDAGYLEGTEHMVTHCSRVLAALQDARHLPTDVSGDFAENAKTGMSHWVEGGKERQLEWGVFHFRR